MSRFVSLLMITMMVFQTTGCSRFNYLKTSTANYNKNTSAEGTCSSLGTNTYDSSYDWCIAAEDRARGRSGWSLLPVPDQSPSYSLVW